MARPAESEEVVLAVESKERGAFVAEENGAPLGQQLRGLCLRIERVQPEVSILVVCEWRKGRRLPLPCLRGGIEPPDETIANGEISGGRKACCKDVPSVVY